jgi:hypothetical protein
MKAAPQNDEKAIAKRELAGAKAAITECEKQLSESGELADLKKTIADTEASLKAKQKELSATLEQKLDKNPAYIEASSKKKELDKIESELAAKRKEAGDDPKVQALRKEAADLKANSEAKTKEANAMVENKFNSDLAVKDLLQRKTALASASKDAGDFKNKVINEPSVKALKDQLEEYGKTLSEKKTELREGIAEKMQSDPKYAELAAKLNALTEKITGQKMSMPEGMQGGMAAPEAKAKTIDKATEKKLAEELNSLLSVCEKNKAEIEEAMGKIMAILNQLPPDSQLYKNTKSAVLKLVTSKPKR